MIVKYYGNEGVVVKEVTESDVQQFLDDYFDFATKHYEYKMPDMPAKADIALHGTLVEGFGRFNDALATIALINENNHKKEDRDAKES